MSVEAAESNERILIVETKAHWHFGHHPVAFAELAAELTLQGLDVGVLTEQGWALEGDPGFPALRVHRYGRIAHGLARWTRRVRRFPPAILGERLGDIAEAAVVVRTASALSRRLGCRDVIVFNHIDPLAGSMFATRGNWLFYENCLPQSTRRSERRNAPVDKRLRYLDPITEKLSKIFARRRQGSGRRVHVVTSVPAARDAWALAAPHLEPVAIPFVAVRPWEPIPDARDRLGLPRDERLALFFGVNHPEKDSEVVWEAFSQNDDWRLIIAGAKSADDYRQWARHRRGSDAKAILIDGFADEATRCQLFAACDVVVISFQPGKLSDSGSLVDAVAWGKTVVCSDRCPTADAVRTYALGRVFEPGNVQALLRALDDAPLHPEPEGLARAREDLSSTAIALRNLAALNGD